MTWQKHRQGEERQKIECGSDGEDDDDDVSLSCIYCGQYKWIEFDNDDDGVPVRRSLIGNALQ